ncbi:MAG: cytochrome c biogenesis protein CcsA [Deltaproteobacteria bacterium]|nr:cytochrome c biogenesis protein CcsA [Deltaproteobacteria bacterium]
MIKWLGWFSLAGFSGLGIWIFGYTPIESSQGFSQKIMYLHVPVIMMAYLASFLVVLGSVGYLWKREMMFDRLAKSSAELAMLFFAMALVSGSIWGKPTWGTYWTWDARLTTTLLAFLIYVGYVTLRSFAHPGEKQARLAAVIGIIAFLDIPLIHVSVQWWRTLHQPTTLLKTVGGEAKPAADPVLLYPLFASFLLMAVFFAYLLLLRLRVEAGEEELAEQLARQ